MKLTRRQLRRIISEAINKIKYKKPAQYSPNDIDIQNKSIKPVDPPDETIYGAPRKPEGYDQDWLQIINKINPALAGTIENLDREYFNQMYELLELSLDSASKQYEALMFALKRISEVLIYKGWQHESDNSYDEWKFGMNIKSLLEGLDAPVWRVLIEEVDEGWGTTGHEVHNGRISRKQAEKIVSEKIDEIESGESIFWSEIVNVDDNKEIFDITIHVR